MTEKKLNPQNGAEVLEEMRKRTSFGGERPDDLFWPDRERPESLYKWMRTHVGSMNGKSVLDVGCGYGWLLEWVLMKGDEPTFWCGVDPLEQAIEKCKAKFPGETRRFIHGTWPNLSVEAARSLPVNRLDVAFSVGTLMFYRSVNDYVPLVEKMMNVADVVVFDFLWKDVSESRLRAFSMEEVSRLVAMLHFRRGVTDAMIHVDVPMQAGIVVLR